MKSSIFQHLPDLCLVRILTDGWMWWACMKCISETSPALCNNQNRGVGLGQQGNDADKRHFFFFDNVPAIPPTAAFYTNYASVMGMNNLINCTL